jgi:hypothetical protein
MDRRRDAKGVGNHPHRPPTEVRSTALGLRATSLSSASWSRWTRAHREPAPGQPGQVDEAAGYLAAHYRVAPDTVPLGLSYVVIRIGLSALAVRETRDHAHLETPRLPAARELADREVFVHTSVREAALSAACQDGMVNNLDNLVARIGVPAASAPCSPVSSPTCVGAARRRVVVAAITAASGLAFRLYEPIRPGTRVAEAFLPYVTEHFGNPSSNHSYGRAASPPPAARMRRSAITPLWTLTRARVCATPRSTPRRLRS